MGLNTSLLFCLGHVKGTSPVLVPTIISWYASPSLVTPLLISAGFISWREREGEVVSVQCPESNWVLVSWSRPVQEHATTGLGRFTPSRTGGVRLTRTRVVAEVPGLAVVQVLLVQEEGEAVLPPLVLVAWPVLAGPALWAWAGPADVISLYVIIAQSTVTQLHSDHAHHMPSVLTPGLTQYNYILSWDPSGSEHVPPLQTEDTSPYSNTLNPSSHGKQKLQL